MKGETSICAAETQLGVNHHIVNDWVRLHETEGIEAFLSRRGNREYARALKGAAVKDYLSGRDSLRGICKIYKIRSTRQLRDWIMVYNGHKDCKKQTGGSCMTKGRETAQTERVAVAKACIANEKNYGEVAITYNVSYQQPGAGHSST